MSRFNIDDITPKGYEIVKYGQLSFGMMYLMLPEFELCEYTYHATSEGQYLIVEKIAWKPVFGDTFFYLGDFIVVMSALHNDSGFVHRLISNDNYFKTYEEAASLVPEFKQLLKDSK